MFRRTPPPDFNGYAVWSYEIPKWGMLKLVHYPTKLYGWRWFNYSDGKVTESTRFNRHGSDNSMFGQYGMPELALSNACHTLGLDTHNAIAYCGHDISTILDAWKKYVAETA